MSEQQNEKKICLSKSESIADLAKALVAAQGEMKPAEMNETNPFFNSKYADLGAVIEATRPALVKNGLAVSQAISSEAGYVSVTSILLHQSGQWIESTVSLPLSDEKGRSAAQSAGAIISYLRRYAYSGIVGAYSDDDADGSQPAREKPSAYDWTQRADLVKKVAAIPYFAGSEERAVTALKYLLEHKSIRPDLKDEEILAIADKAAHGWADKKAAKK